MPEKQFVEILSPDCIPINMSTLRTWLLTGSGCKYWHSQNHQSPSGGIGVSGPLGRGYCVSGTTLNVTNILTNPDGTYTNQVSEAWRCNNLYLIPGERQIDSGGEIGNNYSISWLNGSCEDLYGSDSKYFDDAGNPLDPGSLPAVYWELTPPRWFTSGGDWQTDALTFGACVSDIRLHDPGHSYLIQAASPIGAEPTNALYRWGCPEDQADISVNPEDVGYDPAQIATINPGPLGPGPRWKTYSGEIGERSHNPGNSGIVRIDYGGSPPSGCIEGFQCYEITDFSAVSTPPADGQGLTASKFWGCYAPTIAENCPPYSESDLQTPMGCIGELRDAECGAGFTHQATYSDPVAYPGGYPGGPFCVRPFETLFSNYAIFESKWMHSIQQYFDTYSSAVLGYTSAALPLPIPVNPFTSAGGSFYILKSGWIEAWFVGGGSGGLALICKRSKNRGATFSTVFTSQKLADVPGINLTIRGSAVVYLPLTASLLLLYWLEGEWLTRVATKQADGTYTLSDAHTLTYEDVPLVTEYFGETATSPNPFVTPVSLLVDKSGGVFLFYWDENHELHSILCRSVGKDGVCNWTDRVDYNIDGNEEELHGIAVALSAEGLLGVLFWTPDLRGRVEVTDWAGNPRGDWYVWVFAKGAGGSWAKTSQVKVNEDGDETIYNTRASLAVNADGRWYVKLRDDITGLPVRYRANKLGVSGSTFVKQT